MYAIHRTRTLVVLATTLLVSACSDATTAPNDTYTPPPTSGGTSKSEAIPSYFYQVRLSGAQNSCGAKDPGTFGLLILPIRENGAYTVEGLAKDATPVTVSGDRMTFSTRVDVDGGAVTITGDWLFPPGRHTFAGTTKYDVSLAGYRPCSFAFVTEGTHDITLSSPVVPSNSVSQSIGTSSTGLQSASQGGSVAIAGSGQPDGPPLDLSRPQSAIVATQSSGSDFGSVGQVAVLGGQCFNMVGYQTLYMFYTPLPKSRSNAIEGVYFRFQLHGYTTVEAAVTASIVEILKPFSISNVGYDSGWWYTAVGPTGASYQSYIFAQDLQWMNFPGRNTTFSRSGAARLQLPPNSAWFMTVDVYWGAQGGRPSGLHHAVLPVCR